MSRLKGPARHFLQVAKIGFFWFCVDPKHCMHRRADLSRLIRSARHFQWVKKMIFVCFCIDQSYVWVDSNCLIVQFCAIFATLKQHNFCIKYPFRAWFESLESLKIIEYPRHETETKTTKIMRKNILDHCMIEVWTHNPFFMSFDMFRHLFIGLENRIHTNYAIIIAKRIYVHSKNGDLMP